MKKIIVILISSFVFLSSCASHYIQSKENTILIKLENSYKKYKGVKYRYGGTDKRGFDCSGFVQRVYREDFQISLPRTTKDMMKIGEKVSKSKLKPGDLVFFHPTRKYYHVGIYVGNGVFMHASTSRGVTKSKIDLKYWKNSYVTARRILK